MDRVPRRYGPTGRRSDDARVVKPRVRPRGGGVDRVPRRYGPKGRRSGSVQVEVAARGTTWRRCCGRKGRRSGSPLLDR